MKHYENTEALNQKILKGVNTLADNVATTLGPKGRNVILQEEGKRPIITKDGVTVAKFVELQDPFENVGAQVIKQASLQTNTNAGDGTTTATVLAREILNRSQKYLTAGASPTDLKRGINKAVAEVTKKLKELSRPIESEADISHIAMISANNDTFIGNLVAMAVDSVGKDGSITIEEARSNDTSLDVVEGFRFDSGWLARDFVTDKRRGVVRYENPYILVTDSHIDNVEELLPALELAARDTRPFVIIAENIEGQALAAMILNAHRGSMKVAGIKAPRYGEERRSILKDLAISCGATFITRDCGVSLRQIKLEHFGTAKTIESSKGFTTIVDGQGDYRQVEERIETIKEEIAQTESLPECERLQERITRLSSGVAIIRVGAPTEVDMIEKKHRVEDALEAVKSAQEEGIVAGGGVALLVASQGLEVETDNEDQIFGVEIVKEACAAPIRQMALNAGVSPDIVVSQVVGTMTEGTHGYDFYNGQMVNMNEAGIIDPAKVTRCALENAASAASTLITTNYAIVQTKQK